MKRLSSTVLAILSIVSMAIRSPHAQTAAEGRVHAVAYVEVGLASRAAALAALKAYRESSAKEDGYLSLEVFEQAGRRGHFTVIEAWKDQKSSDSHASGPSRRTLMTALESSRLSDYDQRPYKPLSIGAGRALGAQAVYVISHVDTAPPPPNGSPAAVDGPGLLRRLADASRQEPGCLQFDVLQHTMRGNHFTVIEAWQSQAALDRHAAASHTKAYRNDIAPLLGSPLDERIYNAVP